MPRCSLFPLSYHLARDSQAGALCGHSQAGMKLSNSCAPPSPQPSRNRHRTCYCQPHPRDLQEGGEERLHPVLWDATYIQIQEEREYVTITAYRTNRDLSDRINAIHQEGYELQHITSDEDGYLILAFRKITDHEEPASPTSMEATN